MIKEAKEGDRIPGGYVLTGLGAATLNSSRSREVRLVRATAWEKIAYTYRETEPKVAHECILMNDADMQSVFFGQRKTLTVGEIAVLKNHEKEDIAELITKPRF